LISKRIFIVGCPRSGTTLLQGLLSTHPDSVSFTESHFFDFCIKKPKDSFFYYVDRNANKHLVSFLTDNKVHNEDAKSIMDHIPQKPLIPGYGVIKWSKYFISIFDRIAEINSKNIWIEKTPDHLNRIDLIEKTCPDAIFVHIIRDGKDVVASLYNASKKWKKNYTIKQCIDFWNNAIQKSSECLGKNNHTFISYTDLVKDYNLLVNNFFIENNMNSIDDLEIKYRRGVSKIITEKEAWKSQNYKRIKHQSKFYETFNRNEQKFIMESLDVFLYKSLINRS